MQKRLLYFVRSHINRKIKEERKKNYMLDCVLFYAEQNHIKYGIIGGAISSIIFNKKIRDWDIVLEIPKEEIRTFLRHYENDLKTNSKGGIKIENIDIWSSYNHAGISTTVSELYKYTPLTINSFVYDGKKLYHHPDAFKDLKNKKLNINNINCIDNNIITYLIEKFESYTINKELINIVSKMRFVNVFKKYRKHYKRPLSQEKFQKFVDYVKNNCE